MQTSEYKIFVGNVPYHCTQEEFCSCFEDVEGFIKAEIVNVYKTTVSRGFGFVTVKTLQDANKLKTREDIVLKGRILRFTSYSDVQLKQFNVPYETLDRSNLQIFSKSLDERQRNHQVFSKSLDERQRSQQIFTKSLDERQRNQQIFTKALDERTKSLDVRLKSYDERQKNQQEPLNSYFDASFDTNYVFVDGIPEGKTRKWLKEQFHSYEPLGKCFIAMDDSGRFKNNGLIEVLDDIKYKNILMVKFHTTDECTLETNRYRLNNAYTYPKLKSNKTKSPVSLSIVKDETNYVIDNVSYADCVKKLKCHSTTQKIVV